MLLLRAKITFYILPSVVEVHIFFPKLKVMALNVNTCQTDCPQSRDMTAEEFLIISNLLLFIIR